MTNTLDDFMRTGCLGNLAEGMTSREIQESLGEAEGISGPGWPRLWKYGALQLGLHRMSPDELPFLTSIALYFRIEEELPPESLSLSGWYPHPGCTFEEFRRHLDEVGIAVFGGVTAGPRKHLVIGPGIRVTFDEDILDSIQHTAKREPERKQFWVSARRRNFDRIRAEARARGISVATLCSRWIDEQAELLAGVDGARSTSHRD